MNEESIATRLKVFMDSMELSHSQFADSCGIPRPTLSQLLSGRNKRSVICWWGKFIGHILPFRFFWLLFGEGDMIVSSSESPDFSHDPISDISIFEGERSADDAGAKENGVEMPDSSVQFRVDKRVNGSLGISHSNPQIINSAPNPRKVIQITVYYDDSTFETFYPEVKK